VGDFYVICLLNVCSKCPAIISQHTWTPLALVPIVEMYFWNCSPSSSLTTPRFSGKKS